MILLLVLSLALGLYSYTLYPALLFVGSKVVRRPWTPTSQQPLVTIMVSAHNEERHIRNRVDNALASDYPASQLQVVVCSDASTDKTNELVQNFGDPRVSLNASPERLGKTGCLNRGMGDARGEIVLFTDANAVFPPDLIAKLTRHFGTPEIGLVSGWTSYFQRWGPAPVTAQLYMSLERHTKDWEGQIASCVGADGAVFAMRRSLYRALDLRDINDLVLPISVVRQGYRAVLDPEAFCLERRGDHWRLAYARQVRIATRTLGAIFRNADLLVPWKGGVYGFFLASHKGMRLLTPFFLLGAFFTNLAIAGQSAACAALAVAQALVVVAGLAGLLSGAQNRVLRFCALFLITLVAHAVAWLRALAGRTDIAWTPQHLG